jgi:tetratricopeptide (TPR) repeat protein
MTMTNTRKIMDLLRYAAVLLAVAAPSLVVAQEGSGFISGTAMPEESGGAATAQGLGRPIPRPGAITPDLEAELGAFEQALQLFELEMDDYARIVGEVVEIEYERRRTSVRDFYDNSIEGLREEERASRLDAIAEFERFLERFPDHPQITPDVMFRLAELYYERTEDEYLVADREFERLMLRFERGIDPVEPATPEKDFTATLDLFDQLVTRFPDYSQIDGALYLSGVCAAQMDRYDESLAYFERLVQAYPDSSFAQESWLRVGEVYFERYEFETARSAYERALGYGDSKWYDKILFKLGWSTYLLGEYDQAIGRFRELLAWYEERGEDAQRALEEEALQYFAISIAEEDWDLDAVADPDFVMPRVMTYLPANDLEYTMDVLDRLAEILFENQRFDYAVQVWREILNRAPLDRSNPWRQEKVVLAMTRLGDLEGAFDEQRRLGETYAPGTEWYREQERLGNAEALAYAEQLARTGLAESGNYYYAQAAEIASQAATTGDPVLERQAMEQFRFAARLYGQFLEQYANDPQAYEIRMYYAQALLYATQFEDAATQFALVRDATISTEFRELAGSLAVSTIELALEREINNGVLEPRAWPAHPGNVSAADTAAAVSAAPEEGEEGDAGLEPREAPAEEPLPELSLAWVDAVTKYVEMGLSPEDDPDKPVRMYFAVGRLLYDFKHYEEARTSFIGILDLCRQQPETGYAAGYLIQSFADEGNIEGLRFWSAELENRSACVPAELRQALAEDLDRLAMGEMAQRAEELVNAGQFEAAAVEYGRLADEYADNEETASRALFNAGVLYEQNLRRFGPAMQQFERLMTEYPNSEFFDDALVRVAVNAKKFFDFDKAIDTFMRLHEIGYSDVERVEYPILDAAELLSYTRQYGRAADTYVQFVDENPGTSRAAYALYRAGTMYQEAGDMPTALATFDRFRRQYGADSGGGFIDVDAAVVDTLSRAAAYYDEMGDSRQAEAVRNQIVAEFEIRRPQAVEARYAAAEVAFERAEVRFEAWAAQTLGDTVDEQIEGIARAQNAEMPELMALFDGVTDYGSADWTVCAYYMRGRVFQEFADKVFEMPVPDFGDDTDSEDQYFTMLDEIRQPIEEAAVGEWEIGYPIMQQLGVVNRCTIETTRQLNRAVGASEYPVFSEELRFVETRTFSPPALIAPVRPVVLEDPEAIDLDGESDGSGEAE